MNFVTAKEARKELCCSNTTLMRWKRLHKINVKVLSSKKVLYDIDSINLNLNKHRKNVIYARVSNTKQFNDLQTQIEIIKEYCIKNGVKIDTVYKDIASGMNENRKEFNLMLNDIIKGDVETVYISFKDRLTRFGFDYFKTIFSKYNTNIVILDEIEESNKTFQDELTEDLISIIHHYSMKLYSNRRKKFKEIESLLEEK